MPFAIDPDARPWSEETIKRSRFVARLRYVDAEADVEELLAVAREAERGAGHHCFAYLIGDEVESRRERRTVNVAAVVSRHYGGMSARRHRQVATLQQMQSYSDDGEPAGTAGAPLFKLGAGGLVRAYSGTLAAAIDTVPLHPRVQMHAFELSADHADVGWIEAELRGRGFEISDSHYGQHAVFTVLCADPMRLEAVVLELTSGSRVLVSAGHVWR